MKEETLYLGSIVFLLVVSLLLPGLILKNGVAFATPPDWWKGSPKEYDQLVENAKKEGKLIWYDSLGDKEAEGGVREFNKLYPDIKIEHTRTRSMESRETILRELRAGLSSIDVLEITDELVTHYKELNLFKKYDWAKFKVDPVQLSKDNTMLKVGGSLHGLAYNTHKVSLQDAPKTWDDLLDPKWKGRKIGIDTRPRIFISLWPAWGEKKMIDYLQKLAKQEILFKEGSSALFRMLAAGEISVYVGATYDNFMKARGKGSPIEYIIPKPVASVSFQRETVLSNAPHPNAAILFLGWLGSGGQDVYDKMSNGEGIPLPGFNTTTGRLLKSKDQLSIFDDEWVLRATDLQKKCQETLGFMK